MDRFRYMDRREVCISMEEIEKSVKSSVVSVLNRLQQEISNEVGNNIHNIKMTSIEKDLFPTSPAAISWTLHKVPFMLRQVNEKAYVPKLISIGPYHHGKEHLKEMENIKRIYFSRMIEETNVRRKRFIDAMKREEEAIRKCYEGPLDHIDSDTFVKMLVLDGCFILQLFQEGDACQIEWIHQDVIQYDLLLLENQLPFSVLLKLYGIITNVEQQEIKEDLHQLALRFFDGRVLGEKIPERMGDNDHDYHLLGLIHDSWLRSYENEVEKKGVVNEEEKQQEDNHGWMNFCWPFQNQESNSTTGDKRSRKFILCATDLVRAGIKFKRKEQASLLDIDFADGAKELRIPSLLVDDNTELILRNMMAYEQFLLSSDRPTLVCDYVSFMDNLIDSGEDVQLLRDADVIENMLGDNEAVAQMFNKLREFTCLATYFHYKEITKKLKKHYSKSWNIWKAGLKRDYFNSPWSCISPFAAFFLLALTVAQTIFSVLSYVNQ